MATSGDNSDFPSSSGTSGYSGGESVSLTAQNNASIIWKSLYTAVS